MANNFKEYAMQKWEHDGLSARCIFGVYTGFYEPLNYPHDPDDLCRCIQVLNMLFKDNEQSKIELLYDVAKFYKSNIYFRLARDWNHLIKTFETEWESTYAIKTYELMQQIIKGE